MFYSSECSAYEYLFQDVGKYHSDADLGTPAEKPSQRTTAWLQGTVQLFASFVDNVTCQL